MSADFNELIGDSETQITDQNREFVAQSFALLSLGRYVASDIIFTEWREVDVPADPWQNYNYRLDGKFLPAGESIYWYFIFEENNLLRVFRSTATIFDISGNSDGFIIGKNYSFRRHE